MARRPRIDRELERYLVVDEKVIVAVRRHWFHLFPQIALFVGATVLAIWTDLNVPRNSAGDLLQTLSLLLWWFAVGWLVWEVLNWRRDWFVATDKRFLLFFGFIRRKVAMMPLLKVTDMTYDRSLLGRIIGYGAFRLESAGQDQAMSVIDHVPNANQNYNAICAQLFGPGSQIRLQSDGGFPSGGSFRPPPPPDGGIGPGGGGPGGAGWGRAGSSAAPDAGRPVPGGATSPQAPYPQDDGSGWGEAEEQRVPESWYRSSNVDTSSRLGDTGEIPVVHVPPEGEDQQPRSQPRHWRD
jgi:hypothetical protein